MRWAGHVELIGEMRNAYNIFIGKPEGERPLERTRHRSEVIIRMDLRKRGWEATKWVHLAQDGY
jgi:hypothetical protein